LLIGEFLFKYMQIIRVL